MYYQHFELSGPPFQFTPSAGVLYPSKTHREALAALEWGLLHEPSGLTLLIGEPGTGKTTLISSILARHLEHVRIAYIGNPKLSFDEILQVITRQLGIAQKASQRLQRLDALEAFLEAHRLNERVTVVIDEAQVIPDGVLEELRLLSNWAPNRQTALRFVFVGQPEFLHRLESPGLRQLNERIGARAMLSPLQPEEIQEYIDYRLQARKGNARSIFASGALRTIAEHSGGIPRRINVLCHNAMLLAYTSDRKKVSAQHARSAVAEYENMFGNIANERPSEAPRIPRKLRFPWGAAAGIAALGAAGIGAGFMWALHAPHAANHIVRLHQPASSWKRATTAEAAERTSSMPSSQATPAMNTAEAAPAKLEPAAAESGKPSVPDIKSADHHLRQIKVKIGDTVGEITRRYLGSDEKLADVIAANPQLPDINRIYPGDVIYVPQSESSTAAEQ